GCAEEGEGSAVPAGLGEHLPAAAEGGVERSSAVVPREPEVQAAGSAAGRGSRNHDLPVGLHGEREGGIVSVEVGEDSAAAPEREVHAPIRVVAGDGDVAEADAGWVAVAVVVRRAALPVVLSSDAGPPFAGGHELPVTLEGERKGDVVARYTPAA